MADKPTSNVLNWVWMIAGGLMLVSGGVFWGMQLAGSGGAGANSGPGIADFSTNEDPSDWEMSDAEQAYARGEMARVAEILTELASRDNLVALYRLGIMYRDGNGVTRDLEQAKRLLERAHHQGLQDGSDAYGALIFAEAEQIAEPADQIELLEQAVDTGHPGAQAILGSYLLTGTGVQANPTRALDLLRSAAEGGDVRAQSNLGYMYASGTGVSVDDEQALRWYLAAAEQGMVRAQAAVGLFYEQGRGTQINISEAMRWYVNAYDGGAPGVGARLGSLMALGTIEARSSQEAVDWALEAARAGQGEGVAWLEEAANRDMPEAYYGLAQLYVDGEGVAANAQRAVDLIQQGADAGSRLAQLDLARRHAAGNGVEQDYVRAHMWANLAAAAGAEGAASERDIFAQFLDGDQLADAQARATQWQEARRAD